VHDRGCAELEPLPQAASSDSAPARLSAPGRAHSVAGTGAHTAVRGPVSASHGVQAWKCPNPPPHHRLMGGRRTSGEI